MPSLGTIHERIFAHALGRPAAPFVTVVRMGETRTLSYADLADLSARYASAYATQGVRPGDTVAIILPQSTELFPAFLGAMSVGAVPALLPPPSTKQDPDVFWSVQDATLGRMRATVVVTDGTNRELLVARLPAYRELVLGTDELPPTPLAQRRATSPPISDELVAFLQFSSGTTGLKKGVALTHRIVLRQLAAYARAIDLSPRDRVATWLPYYHDMGLIACFLLPAVHGLPVVCLDPFEWALRPTTLLDVVEEHACTLTWLPNFAFHHILRAEGSGSRRRLASLRACIDCSEPCRPETLELFRAAFVGSGLEPEAPQVSYAMAENVFAVTQTPLTEKPRVLVLDRAALESERRALPANDSASAVRLVSCGRPIETARIAIMGDDGNELPEGRVGSIAVGGQTLFSGYHAADAPTENLEGGWFRTSDRGFLLDGELYVTGRSEDVLIINGRNLYAHDIEQALNVHAAVKPGRAIALGVFNPAKGSDELVLVVESSSAPPGEPQPSLRRRLAEVVASASGVSVTAVHFVEPGWLLKTTSGKVSRRANLDKYRAMLEGGADPVS